MAYLSTNDLFFLFANPFLLAQNARNLLSQNGVPSVSPQVESLQAIIKDKTEDHTSLLAASQQAQRDLAERNEEIDKLAGRIRELEQAVLNSAESNRSVSQLEQELHRVKLREQELTQVRKYILKTVFYVNVKLLFMQVCDRAFFLS